MKDYRNGKGQVAGKLYDDGIFRKVVITDKHWFKKLSGWGIDKKILLDLPKGTEIRIKDDKGDIWSTTVDVFLTGTGVDFDHGEQFVLHKDIFTKNGLKGSYAEDWGSQVEVWNAV